MSSHVLKVQVGVCRRPYLETVTFAAACDVLFNAFLSSPLLFISSSFPSGEDDNLPRSLGRDPRSLVPRAKTN